MADGRFANLFRWAQGYRDAEGIDQHHRASVLSLFGEKAKAEVLAARMASALRPLLIDADEEWLHKPEDVRAAEDALTAWEEHTTSADPETPVATTPQGQTR